MKATRTFAPNEAGRLVESLLKELVLAQKSLEKGDKTAAMISIEYALHIADESLQNESCKLQLWPETMVSQG